METIYKLTGYQNTTYNGCVWEPGEWKEVSGDGELCGKGWLHCYNDPFLAVLFNPIHANLTSPVLWVGEGDGEKKTDRGLKQGHTKMRVLNQIPLPGITRTQKTAFAILCALEVYREQIFAAWAAKWLSGEDRSYAAAAAYADAAYAAYDADAADAAAAAAARAADAADAADAAARAADAATRAAADAEIDFAALAQKAMAY
jgi:hypothetical protein